MALLANLSETQRRAVMIGVPLLAGIVVVTKLKAKSSATPAAPTGQLPAGVTPVASGDVIGTGQLAEFESLVTSQLSNFASGQNAAGAAVAARPAPGQFAGWSTFAAAPGEKVGDIARGEALTADRQGGAVLDAWGGIQPFGTLAGKAFDYTAPGGYTPGQDTARSLVLDPSGLTGYTVDASGGTHEFKVKGTN